MAYKVMNQFSPHPSKYQLLLRWNASAQDETPDKKGVGTVARVRNGFTVVTREI